MITQTLNAGETPYLFFLDLSKAFDMIDRKTVYERLTKVGIPRKIIRLIKNMYSKTKVRYKTDNKHTKYIQTKKGVPQGDPLSTIIFNLVINPMLRELEKANICYKINKNMGQTLMMYADDFACICESKEQLQEAINICKKCVDFFALKANESKSAGMQFIENCNIYTPTHFTW